VEKVNNEKRLSGGWRLLKGAAVVWSSGGGGPSAATRQEGAGRGRARTVVGRRRLVGNGLRSE
jgi:hypothetical protein